MLSHIHILLRVSVSLSVVFNIIDFSTLQQISHCHVKQILHKYAICHTCVTVMLLYM